MFLGLRQVIPQSPFCTRPPPPQPPKYTASGNSASLEGVSHPLVGKSSGGKWVLPRALVDSSQGRSEVKALLS